MFVQVQTILFFNRVTFNCDVLIPTHLLYRNKNRKSRYAEVSGQISAIWCISVTGPMILTQQF